MSLPISIAMPLPRWSVTTEITRTIQQAMMKSPHPAADCWWISDVDKTLTKPWAGDPIHHMLSPTQDLQKLWDEFYDKLYAMEQTDKDLEQRVEQRFIHYSSAIFMGVRSELTDDTVGDLIRWIRERGSKAMAFSIVGTGSFGRIRSFQEFRVRELQKAGIDFREVSPHDGEIEFAEFPDRSGHFRQGCAFPLGRPWFGQGYMFSAGIPKGIGLRAFLSRVAQKPRHIFFVDDDPNNLVSMEGVCKEENIDFHGFLFDPQIVSPPLDEVHARAQFEHLLAHGEWVPRKSTL